MPDSDPAYTRVAKVANRLLKANTDLKGIHGKEWTISVIENAAKNAFVLPVSFLYNIQIPILSLSKTPFKLHLFK